MERRFTRAAAALALVSALPATTAAAGAAAVAPTEAARRYVQKYAPILGLAPADIAEMAVSSEIYSATAGSRTSTSSSSTRASTSTPPSST
jgi:hypothetical protein